ncbi:hypothetical protein [Variovorax sp. WS11]|uniref:hypothetical protein n=1 Tax=Variovorax sp. WS11 TaxID=1105204 RepID=UPI0011B2610D|nr:hypothetical protein [Variovorax sp. WS11]NDZ18738.1 hypothetical protein [Variovorax sp. WS11]
MGLPTLNALVHRIAVLSNAHRMPQAGATGSQVSGAAAAPTALGQGFANPCADPLGRKLLARTRRAYAQRGALPRNQRALTPQTSRVNVSPGGRTSERVPHEKMLCRTGQIGSTS